MKVMKTKDNQEFSYYTDPYIVGEKSSSINPALVGIGILLLILIIGLL